ncbi:hypothetical protein [Tardiphaga sp. 841_E9_N1_2]|jgi:hypothetical protein|uniref:hypothetical protein n=1 Tax=Tardiphaga sp. 841_E9_N1_2 TaxID=3240762 RepID=UPI003F268FA7
MPIYKLQPVKDSLNNDSWAATSLKEECWIDAETEELARVLIEGDTKQMVDVKPGEPMNIYSPWRDPSLTNCAIDNDATFVEEARVIFLAGGKRYRD